MSKRPPTSLSSSGDAARVPPWAKAHPATLAPEQPLFFIEGRHVPACIPLLLPLLSGDIKTNPGLLTHYNIRCSGVRQHAHIIPRGWRCLRCHPSHNTTLPPLSSLSTPPLPVPSPLSPTLPSYMHRIGRAASDLWNFCSLAPCSVSHILLHGPSLQLHRASHHIHSLGQLWTHPQDCVAFLRDSAFI